MPKPQGIRDPIHDLIEFGTDHFDQLAWNALNALEFQRLRRVKQLGSSELVFPGATHSRFAHSVGVFCTARRLSALIRDRLGAASTQKGRKLQLLRHLFTILGTVPLAMLSKTPCNRWAFVDDTKTGRLKLLPATRA
jgi:uncharacterized protein